MPSSSSSSSSDDSSDDLPPNPNPNPSPSPLEGQFESMTLGEPDIQNDASFSTEQHDGEEAEEDKAMNGSVNDIRQEERNDREESGGGIVWRRTNSEVEFEAEDGPMSSPSSSGYAGERGTSSNTSGSRISEDDEIEEVGFESGGFDVLDSQAAAATWVPGKRHVDEGQREISFVWLETWALVQYGGKGSRIF